MVYHGISYNLYINLSSLFLLPQFLLGLNDTPLQDAEVVDFFFCYCQILAICFGSPPWDGHHAWRPPGLQTGDQVHPGNFKGMSSFIVIWGPIQTTLRSVDSWRVVAALFCSSETIMRVKVTILFPSSRLPRFSSKIPNVYMKQFPVNKLVDL